MAYKSLTAFGAGLIMLVAYSEWEDSFVILLAILAIAWLLLVIYALSNVGKTPSVTTLLRTFRRKVDHARQQSNAALEDQLVLRAFDELDADIKSLLQRKKVRLARVNRDVMSFMYPAQSQSVHWRPPSLSELGYLLDVCKRRAKDAPVLAIYQLARENPDGTGAIAGTYEIMRKDMSSAFASTITISVATPHQRIGVNPTTAKMPIDTREYRSVSSNHRAATH
jgi:hypothetical protein